MGKSNYWNPSVWQLLCMYGGGGSLRLCAVTLFERRRRRCWITSGNQRFPGPGLWALGSGPGAAWASVPMQRCRRRRYSLTVPAGSSEKMRRASVAWPLHRTAPSVCAFHAALTFFLLLSALQRRIKICMQPRGRRARTAQARPSTRMGRRCGSSLGCSGADLPRRAPRAPFVWLVCRCAVYL